MPSGSKKRKSPKKKKKTGSTNHVPVASSASTHANGGDVVEHQNDKESDVLEFSSLASQDYHRHPDLPSDGEEEILEGENISNIPSVEGSKVEVGEEANIVVGEENLVLSESEFKIDNGTGKRDGKLDHAETAGKSYDGGSSECSNSSSDDESHGNKISQASEDIAPVVDVKIDCVSKTPTEAFSSVGIEEAGNAVVEDIGIFYLEREESAKFSVASYINESVIKENGEKSLVSVETKVSNSPAFIDVASEWEEEGAVIQSVENVAEIKDPYILESVIKEKGEKRLDSVEDKVGMSLSFTDAALEKEEVEAIIQPVENIPAVQGPSRFESVIKENREETLCSVEEGAGISKTDAASEQREEEAITQSVESLAKIEDPCVFESEIKENRENMATIQDHRVFHYEIKENEETRLNSFEDKVGVPLIMDAASQHEEMEAILQYVMDDTTEVQDPYGYIKEDEKKRPRAFKDELSILRTTDTAASEHKELESILSIKDEKRLSSVEDEVGISQAYVDVPVEKKEEEIIQSFENIASVQDQNVYIAPESDDRLTRFYNSPIANSDSGADGEKIGGITEPLLAPIPHTVQTASWKGCCGLFEVCYSIRKMILGNQIVEENGQEVG